MSMNPELAQRVKNECAGVIYSGIAESAMNMDETIFGTQDEYILLLCKPENNYSRRTIRYWWLPKEMRKLMANPNESELLEGDRGLFFFHYMLDKKRLEKTAKIEKRPINFKSNTNRRIFGGESDSASCLYNRNTTGLLTSG